MPRSRPSWRRLRASSPRSPLRKATATAAGATILTVARSGGSSSRSGIDPSQRRAVAVGQAASLKRLSGGGPLDGRVVRVDGALKPLTKMVDVDLSFPTGALLPGEPMQVDIRTGQIGGWVLPHAQSSPPAATEDIPGAERQGQGRAGHRALSSDVGDVVDGAVSPRLPLIVAGAYQVADGDAVRRDMVERLLRSQSAPSC